MNIELLRRAVAWAEAEAKAPITESRWDQGNWANVPVGEVDNLIVDHPEVPAPGGEDLLAVGVPADALTECGTAFCLAGYICADAGDTFVMECSPYIDGIDAPMLAHVIPADQPGTLVSVPDRALDLLGVTSAHGTVHYLGKVEVRSLFDGNNTIEDVREIARQITVSHGGTL